MNLNKVLVFYKRSIYDLYNLGEKKDFFSIKSKLILNKIKKIKNAHKEHYETLAHIENVLKKFKISYSKCLRGENINYSKYHFIISVGGDGTFLEASRWIKKQFILGVNSSPTFSVGKLCLENSFNFEKHFKKILNKNFKIEKIQRIRIKINNQKNYADCLNEILICDNNPSAMSRYYLNVAGKKEEQNGSGLWISTASGSSGAIKSAGGKLIDPLDLKFQYWPRELYEGFNKIYDLKGGIVNKKQRIQVTSLMKEGSLFIDGSHFSFPFRYGDKADVFLSPLPIHRVNAIN